MRDMDYISFSQYKTYTSCPRSWYLGKVRQAEEKQTWYIPMGRAVHEMIEDWINPEVHFSGRDDIKAEDYFYPLIEKQMLIEPDTSKWLAGGPKDDPIIEEKALQRVRECFEKALEELDAIDVWEVEYDASGRLPGLSVPVKAFVDIVGEHKKKGPVIVDWKTGSTKPGNFQLETYAALLKHGESAYYDLFFKKDKTKRVHGRYVMLAPGSANTRYVDLTGVDPAGVGKKYQEVYDRMQAKHYEAKAGFCRFCFHQENCLVNAGITPRSVYYDKSEEDGYPF